MDLWNEYEGRSIDGQFPLERLIRPEGRSAFFSTTTSGMSTVIRLIESHFDEDEILARWTGVSNLHQPNLLTLTRFGQAIMDETSLVYVVLEPTEADLSQILSERPLTLAETRQVAVSLILALQALHTKGFIHEHIQPANVLAVGEVVKLRSDCIREAPEGAKGIALQKLDVRDLATLLLQALTQRRNDPVSLSGPTLPAPFREIIHNGIEGNWDLSQMASALEATLPKPAKLQDEASPATASTGGTVHGAHRGLSSATPSVAQDRPQHRPATAPHSFPEPAEGRIRVPLRQQSGSPQRWLAGLAMAVFCLMLFSVYNVLARNGVKRSASGQTAAEPNSSQVATPTPTAAPPVIIAAQNTSKQSLIEPSRDQWRVIAYTYTNQVQAVAKVEALQQRFGSLHPAVFSLTGRAPFLVTLGGPLARESAFTLRDKLRGAGLPRDVYAQNYSSKIR